MKILGDNSIIQDKSYFHRPKEARGMAEKGWRRFSKWTTAVIVCVLFATIRSCVKGLEDSRDGSPVSRIAFGSCSNHTSSSQPIIWNSIVDFNPDVFIWLGDNIYGDIRRPFRVFGKERTFGPWKNVPRFSPSSGDEMKSRYLMAKNSPGYSTLRRNTTVIGTWDDHDYGLNDAGKEFSAKVTNQKLLLDFLDEPQDSPRRKRAGVYTSYTFGPMGGRLKVILLDTRYHRDPLFSDGSILGDLQWQWLEEELRGPTTAITIIGSSIQVISNLSAITGPLFYMESWGCFPKERTRLFKLISDTKREGTFFISGDVHFGEIARHDCATGYPLYDITSSGITQAVEKAAPPPLHLLVRLVAKLIPTTMRVMDESCRYSSCTYGKPNFGTIEIDWNAAPVNLKFEVRDEKGEPVIGMNASLSQLGAQSTESRKIEKDEIYKRHCTPEVQLPWIVRYRLVILFFCTLGAMLLFLTGLLFVLISLCSHCLYKRKLD